MLDKLSYEFYRLLSRFQANPPKHLTQVEVTYLPERDQPLTYAVQVKLPAYYDLSKWEIVTNWYTLSPRPELIILRATYGAYYIDPTYLKYTAAARAAGYPTWAYHFFLYSQNWKAQADAFLRTVEKGGVTADFIPVLDIEGYLPYGMTRAYANGMIENWLNYVENALHMRCTIYSSKNYLSQLYISTNAPLWLRNTARGKWIAGYPTYPNSFSTMPAYYVPFGLTINDIDFWQYSPKLIVRGITGEVDGSIYLR